MFSDHQTVLCGREEDNLLCIQSFYKVVVLPMRELSIFCGIAISVLWPVIGSRYKNTEYGI